ncbi:MAG: tripartite tricarboxylate transporter substrate binding protein [Pseudomonadota bacterium]|jgi:tripartite-type tricarboxylate transporter receptor subunit TctC
MAFPVSARRGRRLLVALAALACAGAALAQDYPNRPIRMLVGFPPGGGVDIAARLIANELQKTLGQAITVENRSGAAGNIATDAVAKAAPDGYTLLMGNTGSLSINPALYPKLSFDVVHDLAPVGLVSNAPLVVLVHPSQPAKTLKELMATAKAGKGKIDFGTGGAGSIAHLSFALLNSEVGADMVHVPYRGGSPAVTDLVAGQLQVVIEGVPIAAPFLKAGRLRALAVTSAERSPLLPDVPTAAEAGYPSFTTTAWYGVMAPAGTPAPIIARLNAAINTALRDPALREKFAQQGSDVAGGTPEQLGSFLKKELARWAKAVKVSGAKID